MLLQISISIASSMALILALLIRTGMGTSREWGRLKPEGVSNQVEEMAMEREEDGPYFVAPASSGAVPSQAAPKISAEPRSAAGVTRQRKLVRIGGVSLEIPEGKEIRVLEDDSGTVTVLIEPSITKVKTSPSYRVAASNAGNPPPFPNPVNPALAGAALAETLARATLGPKPAPAERAMPAPTDAQAPQRRETVPA